jgi:hypothetical protein
MRENYGRFSKEIHGTGMQLVKQRWNKFVDSKGDVLKK